MDVFLYIFEPQKHIANFGVAVSGVPEALNFLRAGPGAMFTALAVTALYGLLRPNRFLACLSFIVLLTACIVARGCTAWRWTTVTHLQLSELRDEAFRRVLFALALLAYPRAAKSA